MDSCVGIISNHESQTLQNLNAQGINIKSMSAQWEEKMDRFKQETNDYVDKLDRNALTEYQQLIDESLKDVT